MPDEDGNATSLEMLADYECPECGELDLDWFTEDEATMVFGGDANGVMRCPNDDCDEELELTLGASLDQMRMIVERMPELATAVTEQLEDAAQAMTASAPLIETSEGERP